MRLESYKTARREASASPRRPISHGKAGGLDGRSLTGNPPEITQ